MRALRFASRGQQAAGGCAEGRAGRMINEDDYLPKRGYTTRGKIEAAKTAAPAFTRPVRNWKKQWAPAGHLSVFKWTREGDPPAGASAAAASTVVAGVRADDKSGARRRSDRSRPASRGGEEHPSTRKRARAEPADV